MNFLTALLFPFSVLYDLGTRFRNHLYNIGYKRSFEFEANIIAVGNLSVGGTGKSPMIEYLVRLLKNQYRIATLSRGYGRKTHGFRLASDQDDATTLGDEPFQFYRKFNPTIDVAVGEERALAIPFLLAEGKGTEVILLDDAYQHRTVKPGLNILLTSYNKPFYTDHILPMGRLRESRQGARRADIIIMTKCPGDMTGPEMARIKQRIRTYNDKAPIFFTAVRYADPAPVFDLKGISRKLFLFTGIANPNDLKKYLSDRYHLVGEKTFPDHHRYTARDLQSILKMTHGENQEEDISLVTTEKDMVKLLGKEQESVLNDKPVFFIPIETYFLKDGRQFDALILKSVKSYSN